MKVSPKGAPHISSALAELPVEDLAKLVQQGLRRKDEVLATQCFRRSLQVPRATRAASITFVSRRSFTRRA